MTKEPNIPIVNAAALENLPVAALLFDNEKIYYINGKGLEILGIKNPAKFYKSSPSIFDFLLSDFHEKIRKNNVKILSGKPHEILEFTIHISKGIKFDLESRSNLVLYNGKKVIQTIILEITKRKKYEKELIETGELFNQINKHANDIFFKLDFYPKAQYSFISDSLYDVLGYNKKEFISNPKTYEKIIYPEDKLRFIFNLADYTRFVKSKQHSNTIRFYNKNKEIVWLETVYTPVKDDKGNIKSIIGISRNVSATVLVENELKETQQKFDLISTKSREIIYFFTYTPTPKYLYISPSVKEVLGFDPQSFYKDPFFINKRTIGKNNDLVVHEKLASKEQKLNKLKARNVIYQVKDINGKPLWMEDNVTPIKDEKGEIKFVFGVVRNINELKQKEKELNQKWSDYKLLLDQSPISFFIHSNGICLMCNHTAVELLKVKSEKDILGTFIINYIVPEQRQRAMERMREAVKGKEFNFSGYQINDIKGNTINVEIKTVPITYNGIDCVLSLVKDISERELYEKGKIRAELIEEHNKELIKQKNKLSAIFDSSSHLVWTVNKKFALTYFNSNYKNLFQSKYGKIPVIQKTSSELLNKKEGNELIKLWEPYYKRVLKGEHIEFERKDTDINGNEVFREVFLSPIVNEKGEVFEIACLAHDITERKKLEKENTEKASKLKAIFESGTNIMWTVDKQLRYTSFNSNFSQALFSIYSKHPEIGKVFIFPNTKSKGINLRTFWAQKYKEAFDGNVIEFITERKSLHGETRYRQIYLHPIYNERSEIIEVSGMGIDITDKIINEQKVNSQNAKIKAIFEGGTHFIWTINRKNQLTTFNKNYTELIKRVYKLEPKKGTVINKGKMVSNPFYNEWWNNQCAKAFAGEPINFETAFTDKKGNKIYLDVFLNPVFDGKDIVEVSGFAHDITERIKNQEQIKEQTAKLKAIFESGSQLMWTINHKKEITSFNQNYANALYKLYGFYPTVNKSIRQLNNGTTKPYQQFWDEKYSIAFSGQPIEFTTERFNGDGSKVYRQYVLYPIKDQNNQVIEVSGLGIDITENKLYEEKITQSLKEKEVLLKEVHHRVKNNMQVISSILNLQSSYVTDEYALNLLKESQNRIKTMAYIHESLYQNKTFSSINFSDYITTLVNNILHSYTASIQKVKLELNLQKIILNLDTSIPAGLIINELVTNAIKHAFKDVNQGILLINLYTKDNILFLEVSDNGKGFPKEIDFKNTNSLGLQLVNTLIEQLNGTIELKENTNKGAGFYINFPM